MAAKPVIAVAWFRSEDYQRMREISKDEMIPTFEEFEIKMSKKIADLEATGIVCKKLVINPDELLAFARELHRGRIDTSVRSKFAALLLDQSQGTNH